MSVWWKKGSGTDWVQTDALVLSPGPGLPEEHPQLLDVLKEAVDRGVPVLGVCLGMQAIHVLDGGALTNMNEPLHGRVTSMDWDHNCRAGRACGRTCPRPW